MTKKQKHAPKRQQAGTASGPDFAYVFQESARILLGQLRVEIHELRAERDRYVERCAELERRLQAIRDAAEGRQ